MNRGFPWRCGTFRIILVQDGESYRARRAILGGSSGIGPLRVPLIWLMAIDPVFAILSLVLLAAPFAFLSLFATIAHMLLLIQFKGIDLTGKPVGLEGVEKQVIDVPLLGD